MLIDIFLILFCFAGFWLGYKQGIVRVLFSILGYLIALLITLKLTPWMVDIITRNVKIGKLFTLIFGSLLMLIILIFLIRWLFKKVDTYLQKSKLSPLSKIIGGIIMSGMGIIVLGFLLWTVNVLGLIGDQTKQSSFTFRYIDNMPGNARSVMEEFKPLFRRYWELMQETIQESKSKTEG